MRYKGYRNDKARKMPVTKIRRIFGIVCTLILADSLYRSRPARPYTLKCPSNAPESSYYGNRLPIHLHDTHLYVLSGLYKNVMIERRGNVRKNLDVLWRWSERIFGERNSIGLMEN